MRVMALMILVLLLLCCGCGSSDDPADTTKPPGLGSLPGLKASPDKYLRDELARIKEEGGTPEQLAVVEVEAEENAARGFLELFSDKKLQSILDKSQALFPQRGFEFDALQLEKLIDFHRRYESQRLDAREALKLPKCDLGIDFTSGFEADLSLVAAMRICARLESFIAAEALANDEPEKAIESLAIMFRIASFLSNERHFEPRLKAASLRTEAFSVLQAIVQHDKIRRRHLVQLHEMIEQQLSDWPDDTRVWIGDRALGLHCYEMVRNGELPFLLTAEEEEQFKKEGVLNQVTAAAQRTADADTRYYLEAMRRIIDSCGQPYHERAATFIALREDLDKKRNTPEFPFVAGRLLLVDIENGQAIAAQDRAHSEAWAIALALALDEKPAYGINPLNGKPYEFQSQGTPIMVSQIGNDVNGNVVSVSVPVPRDGKPGG